MHKMMHPNLYHLEQVPFEEDEASQVITRNNKPSKQAYKKAAYNTNKNDWFRSQPPSGSIDLSKYKCVSMQNSRQGLHPPVLSETKPLSTSGK
mmetsp:Transcript_7625/g.11843  ORF Transcript_7625/g.11843 Transcript_7625/m.11843 type:complete len:93 (+) Transcript_7625:2155-2433(+)